MRDSPPRFHTNSQVKGERARKRLRRINYMEIRANPSEKTTPRESLRGAACCPAPAAIDEQLHAQHGRVQGGPCQPSMGVVGRPVGEGQVTAQAVTGCLPAEVKYELGTGFVIAGDLVKICCDPQRAMIPKRRRSIAAATAAQHRFLNIARTELAHLMSQFAGRRRTSHEY